MANSNHCSSRPSQPSSSNPSTPSPNVFTAEFRAALEAREDAPLAALEAETRGPWKVVKLPPAGVSGGGDGGNDGNSGGGDPDRDAERWAVLRSWEDPCQDQASAIFEDREYALLAAAALEVASRGSDLGIGLTRDDRGQVVVEWRPEQGAQTVGHFAVWDQDVVAAMRLLGSLLRVPEALARLVDAGGAPIVELIGRRLAGA